jgi:hypothetical protein
MRELTMNEVQTVNGAGSNEDAFNYYADVLLAGGALAVGTGVLAGAGAFALGLGGAIKLGLAWRFSAV